jgi:hypothetical protein
VVPVVGAAMQQAAVAAVVVPEAVLRGGRCRLKQAQR